MKNINKNQRNQFLLSANRCCCNGFSLGPIYIYTTTAVF